jgi:hypothetical protein
MAIFEMSSERIEEVPKVSFSTLGIRERQDIQRILRECLEVIAPETMVLCEEFGDWEDSKRRIDLLGVDRAARLVVIELKRTEDGGHMELQALRYAAMVSTMTFDQAIEAHRKYLEALGLPSEKAEQRIREFLSIDEGAVAFSNKVRIVLAAADFSREITSSVLWLNQQGLDVKCVRLRPHSLGGRTLLDIQQVIPLPEAAEFQIAIREKSREIEAAQVSERDFTKFRLSTACTEFEELNKRRFILEIVREGIRLGVSPEKMVEALPWRSTTAFISCDGEVDANALFALHPEKAVTRYFNSAVDTFHISGRTYLLSNQWGVRTEEAVNNILAVLPEGHGMSYSRIET